MIFLKKTCSTKLYHILVEKVKIKKIALSSLKMYEII